MPRRLALVSAAAAAVLVFLADWATGAEISLSFFYMVPVAVAAWWGTKTDSLAFVAISLAGWVGAYFLTGDIYSGRQVLLWNAVVEAAIFTVAALGLGALRSAYIRERALRGRLELAYRQIDDEMRAVGDLQRRMLPAGLPVMPGLSIATHYSPSTRAGGDYYDFLLLPDGRLVVFIADASGHGSPAAVLMAMTRVLLHTAHAGFEGPDATLTSLHERLRLTAPAGTFVTACLLVVSAARERMDYAIAGHDPPIVLRATGGAIEPLENPSGLPLAFPGDARVVARSTGLELGDIILLFTDGLTESLSPDGRFFGTEGVCATLATLDHPTAEQVVEALCRARRAHAGQDSLDDDLTVLAVQATGEPGVRSAPGAETVGAHASPG